MPNRLFRYLPAFLLWIPAYFAFTNTGWLAWLPVLYSFVAIPLLELVLPPNTDNLNEEQAIELFHNQWFTWLLVLVVPIQYFFLWLFLNSTADVELNSFTQFGRILSMGVLCGVYGINVAHELGHRSSKWEQILAKALLLTSSYTHFFIEHNRGHHRNVSTPADPSSARYNEPIYSFWLRTVFGTYQSAWQLEFKRLKRLKKSVFSWQNEMLQLTALQIGFACLIGYLFDWFGLGLYLGAAVVGFLLLETVNYIEHYGLVRQKVTEHRYEDANPMHSWNSNHVLGRIVLFELSRHSDHHYQPAKPYQVLNNHEKSPQMPTGYPGMMLLSLFPPLWYKVMNPRIKSLNEK